MIKLNYFNDEIGKIIVIFIISPIILFKAYLFNDATLALLAILLFIYDFYWLYNYKKHKENNNHDETEITKINDTINENEIKTENLDTINTHTNYDNISLDNELSTDIHEDENE